MRMVGLSLAIALAMNASHAGAAARPSGVASPGGSSASRELNAFEERISAELAARNPQAAALFAQANTARNKDHASAAALYAEVFRRAPEFVHALRRQGVEELALGHRTRAITLLRQALAQQPSVEDMTALASALSSGTRESPPTPQDLEEALALSQRALTAAPKGYWAWAARFSAVAASGDLNGMMAVAERLHELDQKEPTTWVIQALLNAAQQEWAAADQSLQEARDLGLDDQRYRGLTDLLARSRPWYRRWQGLWWSIAAWAAAMPLLFLIGWVLSQVTIRQAKNPLNVAGSPQGLQLASRRAYRGVLWLSCLYYWLSLPLLLVLALGAGAGAIYAGLALGHVPIRLVIGVVFVAVVTAYSIARSLFVRQQQRSPGPLLDLETQPRFREVLGDVARRVGTRPVDTVYVTPGTDFAVMERGGLTEQLRGTAERCLIIGLGLLEGMKLRPFKSVLAHEYGHFSNRDTAGGGFALAVRNSLFTMGNGLARGGAAAWYNPAWLFFHGFLRGFMRVSQGASRLQEVLADRWAATAYGSAAFANGLRHVIDRSVRFHARVNAGLKELVETKRPLTNLYALQPTAMANEAALAQEVESSFRRPPGPYDSHPSPIDRVQWVAALELEGERRETDDDEEVWTLFANRAGLEERLTAQVRKNLAAA